MMKDNIDIQVMKLIKQSDEQQKITIRQYSKLNLKRRVKIFSNHRKIFFDLKEKNKEIEVSVLSYIAFIKAVYQFTMNKDNETEINISKTAIGLKRSRPKSDILIDRWSLIKELKNEHKLSFRDISKYLMKYHKIELAHSTIYKMWQNLEKNKEKKNG